MNISKLKSIVITIAVFIITLNCIGQTKQKTEILLIGTFHFNNPGLDLAKTNAFDILSEKSQLELDEIAQKITAFNPTKIFVERNYKQQKDLDSLYNLYKIGKLEGDYKDEIVQLAFRVGKLNKNPQMDAIDYNAIDFPFDKVMEIMKKRNQTTLNDDIMNTVKKVSQDFNDKLKNNISLTDMLLYHNSKEFRKMDTQVYDQILTAGNDTDFEGANLVAKWNNRNLFMYSLIKKKTTTKDERVMVLLGASHITNIKKILSNNENWKVVELKDVLTTKKSN